MSQKIELFRPCNGTTGEAFIADWCGKCERDRLYRENETDPCEILGRTFMYDEDDPEYPQEWRYQDGQPVCTAFVEAGTEIPRQRCEGTLDIFGDNGK